MNDEQKKLSILTNTPVEITLGGQTYKARRISAKDYSLYLDYVQSQKDAGRIASADLNGLYYLLFLVILDPKPESEDALAEVIPLADVLTLTNVLEPLGFPKPQAVKNQLEKPIGAKSTPE